MKNKVVTIFGGTGFVGSQIVRELAALGCTVKVASRVPERAFFLRTCGAVGQIVPYACDYSAQKSIDQAVKGSDFVVNCVGILFEKKKGGFLRVHKELPAMIAKACKKHSVSRFVHLSALGVDKSKSQYAVSKRAGEKAVLKNFSEAVILRPSIIFGPDDSFFNMFAEMARYTPMLPLIGGGNTKFQPVYVGDVADAAVRALSLGKKVCGKIYELGGPEIFTFKELMQMTCEYTGRKRCLVKLPWRFAKIKASFLQILPKPPLTCDQVESLKTDNVVSEKALTLADLRIKETGLEQILPSYMEAYCAGGKFSARKQA